MTINNTWEKLYKVNSEKKIINKKLKCIKCNTYKTSACYVTMGLYKFPDKWDVRKSCCEFKYTDMKNER